MTLPPPAPLRTARGSVLLVTVLLALVAASIAYVAISGALTIELQERDRRGIISALRDAESTHRRMAATLAVDPTAHLTQVLAGETARTCAAQGRNIPAGEPWPAACGTPWSYTLGTEGGVLVLPADAAGEPLRIASIIPTPRGNITLESRYTTGDIRPALHLDRSAALDTLNLVNPGGIISSSRDLAVGTVILPAGTLVAAEGTISGVNQTGVTTVDGTDALAALGRTAGGSGAANHELVHRIACLSLCIIPGGSIPSGPDDISVPDSTRSVRLVPRGDTLDIAFSTTPLGDVDPGDWQAGGSIPVPHLGLVRVDADVLIGSCTGTSGCGTLSRSTTILAGRAGERVRVLLQGNLQTVNARAGLSVHGDVRHLGGQLDLSLTVSGGMLEGEGTLRGAFTFSDTPTSTVTLQRDPQAEHAPPPLMPGIDLTPQRERSATLPPDVTSALLAALPEPPLRATTPGAPIAIGETVYPTGVDVTFETTSVGAGPVTRMQYSLDGGETWVEVERRDGMLRILGLQPGTTYTVGIRAVNAAGISPPSSYRSVTTALPTP